MGLVLGLPWIFAVEAEGDGAERAPHASIYIEGDNDLCNDEDGDGTVGLDDGITNCSTANGTAEHPYLIKGWFIEVTSDTICKYLGPVPALYPVCELPKECPGSAYAAAITICRTSKHILLSDVGVSITTSSGSVAAIALTGSSNVTLNQTDLVTPGIGIYASTLVGEGDKTHPAHNLTLRGVRLRSNFVNEDHQEVPALLGSMVEVHNANVAIRDSVIDAKHRSLGIFVESSGSGANETTFLLERSLVANATQRGVEVRSTNAEFRNNKIWANGQMAGSPHVSLQFPPGTYSSTSIDAFAGIYLSSSSGKFIVEDNDFDVRGIGLAVTGNSTVRLERNHFRADYLWDVALYQEEVCGVKARYNDFGSLRVVSDAFHCFLDAGYNWWGDAGGPSEVPPQIDGRVNYDNWLRVPVEQTPRVRIEWPEPDQRVHGTFELRGNATPAGTTPLVRVEVTGQEDQWQESDLAEGLASWNLRWDAVVNQPTPLTIWVRACDSNECGPTDRVDLLAIPTPEAPIAIIDASPRVANIGDTITLDATRSYSPRGFPLVGYQFNLGNGQSTEWSPSPTLQIQYDSAGTYAVTVQVQDADGLSNLNLAQVIIRVEETNSLGKDGLFAPGTPFPSSAWAILTLGAALIGFGRRRPT